MNLNEYAEKTNETAIYPSTGNRDWNEFAYLALGLASEASEVAGKVKKMHRDGLLRLDDVVDELGDVFWYLARLCKACDVEPEDVLDKNYLKLIDRQKRNVLRGSGDHR